MDGNPRKRLRWYMDFIAKNISTLSENEFQVLLREYLKMPLPLLTEFPSIKIKGEKTLEEWSKFFSEPSLLYNKENSEPFIEDQKQLREFIYRILEISKEQSELIKQSELNFITSKKASHKIDLLINFKNKDKVKFTAIRNINSPNKVQTLINDFILCLDDIEVQLFKKCPECNNWFFQSTKTKKLYCNNKCASLFIVRRKRKQMKEALSKKYYDENKSGAKRARKSYVRKKTQTHPNCKIGRRPTKYKKD